MRHLTKIYTARSWRTAIDIVVILNAAVLGGIAEASEGSAISARLEVVDTALLCILVTDILLCIATKRAAVFRNGWDLFDIAVTCVSVVPSLGVMSSFRVLRVIRVLRLMSFSAQIRAMVDVIFSAVRQMAASYVVLGIVFYNFVVLTTSLFRDIDPDHFGTLGRTTAHLYTVMVSLGSGLENEAVLTEEPWTLPIFVVFLVVVSFGLMNMFIAILVTAMRQEVEKETIKEERARFDRLEQKIDALALALEARDQPELPRGLAPRKVRP